MYILNIQHSFNIKYIYGTIITSRHTQLYISIKYKARKSSPKSPRSIIFYPARSLVFFCPDNCNTVETGIYIAHSESSMHIMSMFVSNYSTHPISSMHAAGEVNVTLLWQANCSTCIFTAWSRMIFERHEGVLHVHIRCPLHL